MTYREPVRAPRHLGTRGQPARAHGLARESYSEGSTGARTEALERYTSALQPDTRADTGANSTRRYLGQRIGAFVGWIDIDQGSGRVWVDHTSS